MLLPPLVALVLQRSRGQPGQFPSAGVHCCRGTSVAAGLHKCLPRLLLSMLHRLMLLLWLSASAAVADVAAAGGWSTAVGAAPCTSLPLCWSLVPTALRMVLLALDSPIQCTSRRWLGPSCHPARLLVLGSCFPSSAGDSWLPSYKHPTVVLSIWDLPAVAVVGDSFLLAGG